jgi:hypothetical protein
MLDPLPLPYSLQRRECDRETREFGSSSDGDLKRRADRTYAMRIDRSARAMTVDAKSGSGQSESASLVAIFDGAVGFVAHARL